jgi:hypothetical protein
VSGLVEIVSYQERTTFFSYMFTFWFFGNYLIRRDGPTNTHSTASGGHGSPWYFIAVFNYIIGIENYQKITQTVHK